MRKLLATSAVALLTSASAHAAVLDFEDFGTTNGDLAPVLMDSFETDFGIRFSSTDGIRVVQVGGSQDGFAPNDTPNPANAFGDFFLGTAFDDAQTDLTIDFIGGTAGYSFDLGDIDDDESFTIQTFGAGGVLLATDVINSGDPGTGNQSVFRFGNSNLGAPIFQVVISGTRGSKRLGIAFDNFNTVSDNTVPVPAALPLFGAALAGYGALKRRRKAQG
ncbi:VPLPA-CTERM sorting domain-containing protein [Parvularcula maris]|uniref:VPLPA-CTERM sorting domain-containing protein n=1 Tax=Parvularcula maris TaxID=2965077 RepID=A0A9X2L8R7_9PROT|nr:VPLPA-CTERM sorting domain-containing protein [Parvularcula maris]MCQ8185004.1 VPLPA-CTERM sorting domain-containing protein [Parvularcula maris]